MIDLAVPHLLSAEDEYNRYRVPKGAVIVPNAGKASLQPGASERKIEVISAQGDAS
jgi:hypothetical protein